jgi:hypothetical protein
MRASQPNALETVAKRGDGCDDWRKDSFDARILSIKELIQQFSSVTKLSRFTGELCPGPMSVLIGTVIPALS